MALKMAAATHVGRRKTNEDAYLLAPAHGVCAVSDGMGGYEGGEVASRLALEALLEFLREDAGDPEKTWPRSPAPGASHEENLLRCASECSHRRILAARQGPLAQMGATLVALLVRGSRAALAHVGDSRAYLLRAGACERLTRDHSLYEQMHGEGLTGVARRDFPYRNQITRALGLAGMAEPDVARVELVPGDRLLLCSDGLHDVLEPPALADLAAGADLAGAAQALVERAFAEGSTDNLTVVLAEYQP